MEKKRRLSSLKKKIIVFVILCWGVPIAVFFAYTTSSYRKGIIEKTGRSDGGSVREYGFLCIDPH